MIKRPAFSWTKYELAVSAGLIAVAAAGAFLWARPDLSELEKAARPFKVERVYSGDGWCTVWEPAPKVKVSADHCHYIMTTKFEGTVRAPGVFDGVFYENPLEEQPRAMIEGETVYVAGYPARSRQLVFIKGKVHFKRTQPGQADYSNPATIIILDNGTEPVTDGMSGGPVFSETFEPLGVINTTNGRADLNGDEVLDDSADVTELHDLWLIQ